MKLIYLGRKNPKVVELLDEKVSFVPNEPTEVKAAIGKVLLENAGTIFSLVNDKSKAKAPVDDIPEAPKANVKSKGKKKK